jgi:hypothetical protein
MSKEIETPVLTVVNQVVSLGATKVDTIKARDHKQADADFYLDVTALTGTAPTVDIDVTAVIGGVTHILGSFTQATGVTKEKINVPNCPANVLLTYTEGGTVTDADLTVNCVRF